MEKLKVVSPLSQENTQTSGGKYLRCPGCHEEWPRLLESGLCSDCDARAEKDRQFNARQRLLIEACLGSKGLKEFHFEQYTQIKDNLEAYNACTIFDANVHNLYLWGPCGSGKSHLAGATWRKWVHAGFKCDFISHPQLSRFFRGREAEEERVLLKKYGDFDLLVIDDIGVGRSTEFANQILYEILCARISACRNGLILTSNLSLEDFSAKVGDDRLPSRIAGMCKVIKVGGPDYRLQK